MAETADNFIITRKRKKYKFAKFAELANCYEAHGIDDNFRNTFAKKFEIVIELGSGTALFLVEQAKLFPERQFIAIDVKADRLYTGAKVAYENNITNIIFLRAHANQLIDIFAANTIDELWLTFSDPFPKKRHAKHRMTHPDFLQIYRKLLKQNGVMHFKTDSRHLFEWSLEKFIEEKLILRQLSFNLHESNLPAHYKIMTSYEQRFVTEGLPIQSVDVLFNDSDYDEPIRQ